MSRMFGCWGSEVLRFWGAVRGGAVRGGAVRGCGVLGFCIVVGVFVVPPVFAQTQPTNTTPAQPILGRPSPPQPLQKPGVEYFVGSWTFKWNGRESAVTPGPRSGTVHFERLGDTQFLEMRVEGKVDGGSAYKESGTLGWHATQKIMAMHESLAGGAHLLSVGDWTSPIALRFESAPLKVAGQTVRLKRTFNILSATSFSVAEELSTNGGPFARLGSGVFTKTIKTAAP